jgi:hypothetical protein
MRGHERRKAFLGRRRPRGWGNPRPVADPAEGASPLGALRGRQADVDPWERLGWAVLIQAVDDVVILRRRGVYDAQGRARRWPVRHERKGGRRYERMAPVMGMMQGDQAALREFFCGGLAQVMLRALGSSLQGAELFAAACSRSLVLPGVWKGATR